MKKFEKLKKIAKHKNSKYWFIGFASILPAVYVMHRSTDILRCRDCAYSGDGIIIRNTELEEGLKAPQTFYAYSNQKVGYDVLRKDTLSQLIRNKKVLKHAEGRNINVSDQELNSLYDYRVSQNESEEKLLQKIKDYYGYDKQQYLEMLKLDILKEKVQQDIGMPLSEWY